MFPDIGGQSGRVLEDVPPVVGLQPSIVVADHAAVDFIGVRAHLRDRSGG
jgi:hypothetical protein